MCTKCFHFCHWKEHNFQKKRKISQKDRKKPNLYVLTQILYDLLSLWATLTAVSFPAFVWAHPTTPSISRLKESALSDKTKYRLRKRLCLLPFLQQRGNQNYSSTVSYLKYLVPRNFTTKSKLKLCCPLNRP